MVKSLPKELQDVARKVSDAVQHATPRHEKERRKWERLYAMYRSYADLKEQHGQARTANDVDSILGAAKRQFGDALIVPYAFATVETVLPRMLTNPPSINVRAKKAEWEDHADPIKVHIETQEAEVDYPLVLQDVAKSGLIYGLGVQKLPWHVETHKTRVLVPATVPTADKPYTTQEQVTTAYSGPKPECVDVFDWIWSPLSYSVDTLSWCVHRAWRDEPYVRRMFESGKWKLPQGWTVDDALSGASSDQRDDIWSRRDTVAGRATGGEREGAVHMVWEYHDGRRVITVLDGTLPVQDDENPYWHGQFPFQIYRPTRVLHEMCGIGEIEAIEQLVEEMNELRTQRRDNGRLVLQRPFAYFDGLVDPSDVAFGPGIGIPVDGDPREVIFPIPLQDLPASGYQEEQSLKSDIERTSGIDDATAGSGSGASETATGVQLVQQAANVRIVNKTKLLQRELVRPAARQWLRLNAQFTTEEIEVVGPPAPGEEDREFSYWMIGPEQYAGEYLVEPEDGSMEPENPVAQAQKGMQLFQAFAGNPAVKQDKLAEEALKLMGVQNPASWIVPAEPQVPMHVLEALRGVLVQVGMQDPAQLEVVLTDPQMFEAAIQQAMEPADPNAPAEAPPVGPPEPQPPAEEPPPEPEKKRKVEVVRDARDRIVAYQEK